jgi:transcriptional regulator with XRE-family HTH domain
VKDANIFRDEVSSQVARILREERAKRHLSMNAIAERAGLSRMMVSFVERGMRNPTLDTLLRLTGALEIDPVEVLRRAVKAASSAKPKSAERA